MELAVVFIAAYLVGSIPFGLILTRAAGLGDIRQIGSGNIGATNVLRTGHKGLAAATLLLDGLKGLIVPFLLLHNADYVSTHIFGNMVTVTPIDNLQMPDGSPAPPILPGTCIGGPCIDVTYAASLAIVATVLGHMFPLWLKFKGGKGVATTLGAALGLNFFIGAAACATWLIMAAVFRYSSLSALVAIAALPGFAWCLGDLQFILPLAIVAALVWLRHHENIKRLLAGTEPKIGKKT